MVAVVVVVVKRVSCWMFWCCSEQIRVAVFAVNPDQSEEPGTIRHEIIFLRNYNWKLFDRFIRNVISEQADFLSQQHI